MAAAGCAEADDPSTAAEVTVAAKENPTVDSPGSLA